MVIKKWVLYPEQKEDYKKGLKKFRQTEIETAVFLVMKPNMFINVHAETIEWACNNNATLTTTTGRNKWHSNKVANFIC